MKFNVHHDNPLFENRIKYVFDFIENHPLAIGKVQFNFDRENEGFEPLQYLSAGEKKVKNGFLIPAQKLLFQQADINLLDLQANQYNFNGYQLNSVEPFVKEDNSFFNRMAFGFDVIETIFFHISRLEEHICKSGQKDEHGRMKSAEQFLVRNKLEKQPVVDHLVFCFLEAIGAKPAFFATSYRFSFDVDMMFKFSRFPPFRSTVKYLLEKPSSLINLWRTYFLVKTGKINDPYDNFEWLLDGLPKHDSVIYFLVGGKSKFDKPLPVLDDSFKEVIKLAKKAGLSVGIHPSYNSWDSFEMMKHEKSLLSNLANQDINLSRQHFLHFCFEKTPALLEKIGVKEDSSIGFADRIGFRCGTGFPFFLYNFKEERPWKFREMPMVVMDVGLIREAGNKAVVVEEIWNRFLSENSSLTNITFNFHNSRFFDAELDGINLYKLFEALRSRKTHHE